MATEQTIRLPLTVHVLVEGGVVQDTSVKDANGHDVPYQLDLEDLDNLEAEEDERRAKESAQGAQ